MISVSCELAHTLKLVHPAVGLLAEAQRRKFHATLPERLCCACRVLQPESCSHKHTYGVQLGFAGGDVLHAAREGCSLSSVLSTNRKGRRGMPILYATNQDDRRGTLSGDSISSADMLLDSSSRLLSQWCTKHLQACRGNV